MDEMIPEWMEKTGNINAVLVKLKAGYVPQAVAEEVAQSLELDARTQAEELNLILNSEVKRAHDQMLMFKTMLMIVAGVIVMLITYTNTIEKTKDIAILKAVGTPTGRTIGTIVSSSRDTETTSLSPRRFSCCPSGSFRASRATWPIG